MLSCRQARDRRASPSVGGGYGRTAPAAGDVRLPRFSLNDAAVARSFYEDVLRGRQVWPSDGTAAGPGLWFVVEGTLIEVCGVLDADHPLLVLAVDAPHELAARGWDTGFDVRVHDAASGRPVLSLIDPFGRTIVLARRESPVRPRQPSAFRHRTARRGSR